MFERRSRLMGVLLSAALLEPLACVTAWRLGARLSRNAGVSFGLLAGRPALALVVSSLVLAAVLWAAFLWRRPGSTVRVGLAITAGGAAANLVERLALGAVLDWIPLPFSSCLVSGGLFFNLADVEIGIGACLAAWAAVVTREGTE